MPLFIAGPERAEIEADSLNFEGGFAVLKDAKNCIVAIIPLNYGAVLQKDAVKSWGNPYGNQMVLGVSGRLDDGGLLQS